MGENADEGRVFVYLSDGSAGITQRWADTSAYTPVILKGNGDSGARFGTAMANAGDLNDDGFNDVVIGAPLTDGGRGAVYVYHGGSPMSDKFKQKILASDITNAQLEYFGQSLQGNVDLDGNEYPDVAVGAPKSDSIAIFRSRPVAKFTGTNVFTVKDIDIFKCLKKPERNCTQAQFCLTVNGKNIESTVAVDIKLKLDPKFNRLTFNDSSVVKSYSNFKLIKGKPNCETVYLKVADSVDNYNDPLTSVLEYDLTEEHKNIALSSISDPDLDHFVKAEANFQKNCGTGGTGVCVYDLEMSATYELPASDLQVVGSKNITDLSANRTRLAVAAESNDVAINVKGVVKNLQQTAFDAQVEVLFDESLSWNEITSASNCIKDKGGKVVKRGKMNVKVIEYTSAAYGNILKEGEECKFDIKFTWSQLRLKGTTKKVDISLLASTKVTTTTKNKNHDKDLKNDEVKISFPVVYRSDADLKSRIIGDVGAIFNVTTQSKSISRVEEIGEGVSSVKLTYEVKGNGYSNIPRSKLSISYPAKFQSNGTEFPLLYLYELKCEGQSNDKASVPECVCDMSKVNKYKLITPAINRADLNTTKNHTLLVNPELMRFPPGGNVIDCKDPTTKAKMCESFSCQINDLGGEAELVNVVAKYRVYTPTFTFKTNVTEQVVMKAVISYNTEDTKNHLSKNAESVTSLTLQRIIKAELYIAPQVVPNTNQIWIYIVAIVGGLILLILAVFGLYKCGFFNSKYAQKKEQLEWQDAGGDDGPSPDEA